MEVELPSSRKIMDSDLSQRLFDGVDIHTAWNEMRAPPNRSEAQERQRDIEQKGYTQVRLWFVYQRYDNPEVVPLLNAVCKGGAEPVAQLLLADGETGKAKSRWAAK